MANLLPSVVGAFAQFERELIRERQRGGIELAKDAGILDGNLLVVDRAAKPENGSAVVVAVNGKYTVKRLRRGPDCIWLDPADPRYQSLCVSVGEELHVFGVVKHAIHTLR